MRYTLSILASCLLLSAAHGQAIELSVEQYDQMKAAGTLPAEFNLNYPTLPPAKVQESAEGQRSGGSCDCWIEPDSTYALAMLPNDDMSSAMITLPFEFNLYGTIYEYCFINNNGNVSFLLPHSTFNASGFPVMSFRMVAPFCGGMWTRAVRAP